MKESLLRNFNFENIEISTKRSGIIRYADDWKFMNVNIITDTISKVRILESTHVDWIQ